MWGPAGAAGIGIAAAEPELIIGEAAEVVTDVAGVVVPTPEAGLEVAPQALNAKTAAAMTAVTAVVLDAFMVVCLLKVVGKGQVRARR